MYIYIYLFDGCFIFPEYPSSWNPTVFLIKTFTILHSTVHRDIVANVADLRYVKLWILLDQIIWVWNIKVLQHRVLKILRFKYLILFQRLNCFIITIIRYLKVSSIDPPCKDGIAMGNSYIHFTETFNIFRLLKVLRQSEKGVTI